jgi:hypothetical protein
MMEMLRQSSGYCTPNDICYRTKVTLPVDLEKDGKVIDVNYADVVNPFDVGAISVERAFLVRKITKLSFDHGALVAALVRKPSEAEGLSLLPIDVVNAALATPSGLWQAAFSGDNTFKTNTIQSLASLTSQVNNINSTVNSLQSGLSLGPGTDNTAYTLNCAGDARAPSGSALTNYVTDTALQ